MKKTACTLDKDKGSCASLAVCILQDDCDETTEGIKQSCNNNTSSPRIRPGEKEQFNIHTQALGNHRGRKQPLEIPQSHRPVQLARLEIRATTKIRPFLQMAMPCRKLTQLKRAATTRQAYYLMHKAKSQHGSYKKSNCCLTAAVPIPPDCKTPQNDIFKNPGKKLLLCRLQSEDSL